MDEQRKPRGPKKLWTDVMVARFPAQTFDRIEEMLREGEDRTEFVREAVSRETKRRHDILRKYPLETRIEGGREVKYLGHFRDLDKLKARHEGTTSDD